MAGEEVEQLRQQATNLQQALDTVQQRLGQLQPNIEPSQTDPPSNKT
jgi:prefoldin subunit 5